MQISSSPLRESSDESLHFYFELLRRGLVAGVRRCCSAISTMFVEEPWKLLEVLLLPPWVFLSIGDFLVLYLQFVFFCFTLGFHHHLFRNSWFICSTSSSFFVVFIKAKKFLLFGGISRRIPEPLSRAKKKYQLYPRQSSPSSRCLRFCIL